MKKILISFLVIAFFSCTKDLTSLNDDPKNPKNVPSYTLFTSAQRVMTNTLTSSNVNLNIFRLIVQYWTETTYTDESNYDLDTREIPQGVWNAFYRDVLRDFKEAKDLIPQDVADADVQKNQIAITDFMMVYTYYYLVTTFGDIPYTESLDIENPFPVYDNAATVYADLLTRLDADIAALNTSAGSFDNADIVYGGDVESWMKFMNSFKLKMGMTIADSDPAKSKSTVESAVSAGVFTSNADNAQFNYLSGPPNTNPVWVDLVQSGRKDFVAATTVVDKLMDLNDPRLSFYITNDAANSHSGGEPGASNNYATFSKPAERITAPDFPALLLSYDEVEFYLAEAAERGYSVSSTAMEHYNNAITASIVWWGGTQAQATAYLAQPSVNYLTATGSYKQKIGEQKWLALYNRGYDEWIEWRRLDFPELEPPVSALSAIPLRFTYPINEQNVNVTNYNAASSAIGGDLVETKLWFDKF
jgi:hypothetical protein